MGCIRKDSIRNAKQNVNFNYASFEKCHLPQIVVLMRVAKKMVKFGWLSFEIAWRKKDFHLFIIVGKSKDYNEIQFFIENFRGLLLVCSLCDISNVRQFISSSSIVLSFSFLYDKKSTNSLKKTLWSPFTATTKKRSSFFEWLISFCQQNNSMTLEAIRSELQYIVISIII